VRSAARTATSPALLAADCRKTRNSPKGFRFHAQARGHYSDRRVASGLPSHANGRPFQRRGVTRRFGPNKTAAGRTSRTRGPREHESVSSTCQGSARADPIGEHCVNYSFLVEEFGRLADTAARFGRGVPDHTRLRRTPTLTNRKIL